MTEIEVRGHATAEDIAAALVAVLRATPDASRYERWRAIRLGALGRTRSRGSERAR